MTFEDWILREDYGDVEQLSRAFAAGQERAQEILEWLESLIGTAFKCECGRTEYNTMPLCQECGRDAPLIHQVAFKLHAESR